MPLFEKILRENIFGELLLKEFKISYVINCITYILIAKVYMK